MTEQSRVVKQLRGIAAGMTVDLELQKDLMQEMFIHFVRRELDAPGRSRSWYLQSCRFRARNYLKKGRSVDSFKRSHNLVRLGQPDDDGEESRDFCLDLVDPLDLRSELITRDILALLLPSLSGPQQQILFLLNHGLGVREVGRELGISHPAVIKHRKKIACLAAALLADSSGFKRSSDPVQQSPQLVC